MHRSRLQLRGRLVRRMVAGSHCIRLPFSLIQDCHVGPVIANVIQRAKQKRVNLIFRILLTLFVAAGIWVSRLTTSRFLKAYVPVGTFMVGRFALPQADEGDSISRVSIW